MTRVFALDLDGTLIDCRVRQLAVTEELLRERGVAFDAAALERLWQHKRDGADTAQALVLCGVSRERALEVAGGFRACVEESRFLALDQVLPGALEALDLLRASGHRLHLLTARTHADRALAQVERLLPGRFDEVHVAPPEDAARVKAARLIALSAKGFAGDTERDAEAARAGGTPFHAVASGQRSEAFLRALGLRVYADLAEVVRSIQT